MSIESVFWATMLAALLIVVAKQIRNHVTPLRRYYFPSSLMAGALGLLLGPEVLGWVLGLAGVEMGYWADGMWS